MEDSKDKLVPPFNILRRKFLKQSSTLVGLAAAAPLLATAMEPDVPANETFLSLEVNGKAITLHPEPRVTLLDLLRDRLSLTGTKKGCDHGQCGACTVHVDGQRVLACLSLAVMQHGKKITTIEGLAKDGNLHPMQEAFLRHDGLQCGYCTPGQIMSGIGCIKEGHAKNRQDIQEFMSGNLCRCGAYPNITAAIEEVQQSQSI